MRETFYIPVGTVSINNFYYGDKRHGIRVEAREWQQTLFHYLSLPKNAEKLEALRSFFDPNKHSYRFSITMFAPPEKLYTKAGQLSAKMHDITNCEKAIVDVFCLPKHCQNASPYGCQNLAIDDRYVTRLFSQKKVGKEIGLRVSITIGPK